MFAQAGNEAPFQPDPELPFPEDYPSSAYGLFGTGFTLLQLLYFGLMVWMLVECLRKDPDRYLWMWVILIFVPIGPLLYFFIRWLPHNELRAPRALRGWTRGKEINQLETAAAQIGNAYHHIQLGDALRETGKIERAAASYSQALAKEPSNPQALWGAALIDMRKKEYARACPRLEKLLEIDPQYKFGDVSLAYGRTLFELGRREEACAHLQKHISRWRHPEGLYLMAQLSAEQGKNEEARSHLQAMLLDINGSPRAIARKHGMWKSRARRMLRRLS